jgi:hypothetical protein
MRRQVRAALGAGLAIGLMLAAVAPAVARTSGKESFRGVLVTTGESGTRTVVSSTIVAVGVFDGVGRVVEVENRPGDPENVSRDDLVFAGGTMHIVNENGSVNVSVNPMTCVLTVRIKQTTKIEGGTGRFKRASGSLAGTVRAWGVAARAPDGTCSQDQPGLVEADVVRSRGTLTF